MKLTVVDREGTRRLAGRLAELLTAGDLVLLSGELGAGKTTLTQALGAALGVRAGIISPTFVLMRQYPSLTGGPDLVHVDAYRLHSAAEIDDIDIESLMDSAVTVVEWGEGLVDHLSDSRLLIRIDREVMKAEEADTEDEPRRIEIIGYGPRWAGIELSALAD
ncbi:tRNA (adenosine(37)-N6)-threonylcarbamoyltransferase complex ATPase subunit type 1 TsaE [Acaricomes phytoseiuli]|uniref:tRNA (adenosine(37)-N6)-threonylcarbamoyltransferase complex ATPase subunit type 1 TsaE n=1 Tax=Acaricomes phytoseiuli TaxID=291968 RepID=UPI00036B5A85|nr:tRNA (adenosine(37)-N6)-threonylcarbamoyltransferase complex ATPase subunit type 1 TsaE [Acaricomes phytoseiuli]MCW1250116.1 tRNA (adenosine(37)-N6)-threonylcarbamoyltransferase complex ATPase subunit type 1 TsaE [Acaricomes phytoseiuli]